ncbi:MAG: carboxypeptidase regulatory-like domain-containing protein [Candidatus Acidiferrales bacterium]
MCRQGAVSAIAILIAVVVSFQFSAKAQTAAKAALSGVVSSEAEGKMEGVLVSAKRVGGNISMTVVSDKQGHYSFTPDELLPGQYKLSIRAVGYDLSQSELTVEVGEQPATADLTLNKSRNLAAQLSSAEWLASLPGTPAQKDELFKCVLCHTAYPIVSSRYDQSSWLVTINRMRNYGPASSLEKPQMLPFHQQQRPGDVEFAKYLSSINLSATSQWAFELKTLARPHGDATKVVVTEYDLPRPDAQPHDAVIDSQGMIWYDDFAEPILGRLDPRTGKTKEWALPEIRPDFPGGSLDLELDRNGNPWLGRLLQAGVARFDKNTEKITSWTLPSEYLNAKSRVPFLAFGPGETVWFVDSWNRSMNLLDPATGHVDHYRAYPDWTPPAIDVGTGNKGPEPQGHFIYGINADSKGVGYFADMAGGNIGVIDPKTGKGSLYPTPSVNSGPRRMHFDAEDKLWFAENYAFKIALFDPKTKQFREWDDPTPWDSPYDTVPDAKGFVWTGGMVTDLVTRLNPKTGEITQYLLPTLGANIRRADVDNSTKYPSFVVGENHQAKIAIVQPLN